MREKLLQGRGKEEEGRRERGRVFQAVGVSMPLRRGKKHSGSPEFRMANEQSPKTGEARAKKKAVSLRAVHIIQRSLDFIVITLRIN